MLSLKAKTFIPILSKGLYVNFLDYINQLKMTFCIQVRLIHEGKTGRCSCSGSMYSILARCAVCWMRMRMRMENWNWKWRIPSRFQELFSPPRTLRTLEHSNREPFQHSKPSQHQNYFFLAFLREKKSKLSYRVQGLNLKLHSNSLLFYIHWEILYSIYHHHKGYTKCLF